MQPIISLISNRSKKLNSFKKDIDAVLNKHTGLRYEGKSKDGYRLEGQYYLLNETGEFIESFEVRIFIGKEYPNTFPFVMLLDNKIDKTEEYHMDSSGLICLDHTYLANLQAKSGLRILDFIDHYLCKYFSWALTKKFGNATNLEEWDHKEAGTIQVYEELLRTTDKSVIRMFLENYCKHPKPMRNDLCYCGNGKKLKKCHFEACEVLKSTPLKDIEKDIQLFIDIA